MSVALFAIAAEKEAQAKQEPLFFLHCGDVNGDEQDEWEVEVNRQHVVDEITAKFPGKAIPLYLAPQNHPERPLEMVASADVPLPEPDRVDDRASESAWSQSLMHQYAEAYAKAAVAAELERCARIVETQNTYGDPVGCWLEVLAAKIRTPASQPKLKGDSNG